MVVGFAYELPIQFVRAKPGVYAVVVAAGVAVVRTFGFVVQQQRRGPSGRGAQPCDVIQVVDHPLQVAPVAAEEGAAVGALRVWGVESFDASPLAKRSGIRR